MLDARLGCYLMGSKDEIGVDGAAPLSPSGQRREVRVKFPKCSGPADTVESVAEVNFEKDLVRVRVTEAPLPKCVDGDFGAER